MKKIFQFLGLNRESSFQSRQNANEIKGTLGRSRRTKQGKTGRNKNLRFENLEDRRLLAVSPLGFEPVGDDPATVVCVGNAADSDFSLDQTADSLIQHTSADLTVAATTITVSNANNSGSGSLRQAIADASAGSTIVFASSLAGSKISLSGELSINKSLTIDASALYNAATQTPGITIDAQSSGRIFNLSGNAESISVSITGLKLTGGLVNDVSETLRAQGGAIYVGALTNLTLNDSLLTANTANGNFGAGGAIYNLGSVAVSNSVFANNAATGLTGGGGGAIYNASSGVLTLTGSSLSNNLAKDTTTSRGSFFEMGGAICNVGTVSVALSDLSFNKASNGGAIYHDDGSLTVTNSQFLGNTALYNGGALYSNREATLVNATIAGNDAEIGGGIYSVHERSVLNLTNSVVAKNFAYSSGTDLQGTVSSGSNNLIGGSPLFVVDPVFDANGVLQNSTTVNLRLQATSPAVDQGLNAAVQGSVDLDGNARIYNNVVDLGAFEYFAPTQLTVPTNLTAVASSVSAIYVSWSAVENASAYSLEYRLANSTDAWTSISVSGTSRTVSNLASGTSYEFKVQAVGDGVYYIDSDFSASVVAKTKIAVQTLPAPTSITTTVNGPKSITVSWNVVENATSYYLAYKLTNATSWSSVAVDASATKTLTNLRAASSYDFKIKAAGDGVYYKMSDWSEVVSATTFENPSTVVSTNLDVVDPSDGLISLREAIAYAQTGSLGSAITFDSSLNGQTITLASTLTIAKNVSIDASALADGVTIGANEKSTVLKISAGTESSPVVLKNLTLTAGKTVWFGGLLNNEGVASVENGKFLNGFAYYGGGVANNGTLTLLNCSFEGNQGALGGAIYNRANGVLTVSGATAISNSVTNYGGFVYNNGGSVQISDSSFVSNSSNNRAGAIYVAAGTVAVDSSNFSGNIAKNFGGAVYNAGTFVLSNSSISGGSAIYGGAIANFKTLTLSNCDLTTNVASKQGGAIYHSSSIIVEITAGSMNGNSAYQGGALYVRIGTVRLTGTEVKSNSVTHNGGAIYSCNQTVLTDCVVSENYAKYYGGGIYNEKIIRLKGTTSVSGNSTGTNKFVDLYTKTGGQVIVSSELADSVFETEDDWELVL